MPPVAGVERLSIEAVGVDRGADDQRVRAPLEYRSIRAERLVAVPEAEVALDAQPFLTLGPPDGERLDLFVRAERTRDLEAAPPVVVAEAAPGADRGQAGLERRHLPLVVAGGQVEDLAA